MKKTKPGSGMLAAAIAALAISSLLCVALVWWWLSLPDARARPGLTLALAALALAAAAGWVLLRRALRQGEALDQALAALARSAEHEQSQEQTIHAVRRDRDLLAAALDELPIGVAVYSPHGRQVLRNRFMDRLIPDLPDDDGDRTGYQGLLQHERTVNFAPGSLQDPPPGSAGPAQESPSAAPVLLHYHGDRWIQGHVIQNEQGVTVVARADVTELARAQQRAAQANKQLSRQSATDGLTGIANRRRFDETLNSEWLRAARGGGCLSLLIVDIDHFKLFNDHYGHVAGDECLRAVARLLQSCVRRAGEMVARYGGEEFVILLPGADAGQAEEIAQRCLDGIARLELPHPSSPTAAHVTFSIGIAHVFPSASHKPASLVNAADTAMYRAKTGGRAQYQMADLADWEIDKDAPRSRPGALV